MRLGQGPEEDQQNGPHGGCTSQDHGSRTVRLMHQPPVRDIDADIGDQERRAGDVGDGIQVQKVHAEQNRCHAQHDAVAAATPEATVEGPRQPPGPGHCRGNLDGAEQCGIDRRCGGQQRSDGYRDETDMPQHGARRLGNGGVRMGREFGRRHALQNHHGKAHIQHGHHADREVDGPGDGAGRIGNAAGRIRHHPVAGIGQKGEPNAGDDVIQSRVNMIAEPVDGNRANPGQHQPGQDHQLDRHQQQLGLPDHARARDVQHRQQDQDPGSVDADPELVGHAVQQRRRIGAEGLGDHRDGYRQCDQVNQRQGAGDAANPEGLVEILADPARVRVAGSELGIRIARQRGDPAAEQEGDIGVAASHQRRLAEQGEDAGADHRADAHRGNRPDIHGIPPVRTTPAFQAGRNRLSPRAFAAAATPACAFTLLPTGSSGGAKPAIASRPGATATKPPPTPLLAGNPT